MLEKEIIPNLNFKPRDYDRIVTPNADSLSDCHSKLFKQLPSLLEKWEVDPESFVDKIRDQIYSMVDI
jgi:hypothetical protein